MSTRTPIMIVRSCGNSTLDSPEGKKSITGTNCRNHTSTECPKKPLQATTDPDLSVSVDKKRWCLYWLTGLPIELEIEIICLGVIKPNDYLYLPHDGDKETNSRSCRGAWLLLLDGLWLWNRFHLNFHNLRLFYRHRNGNSEIVTHFWLVK